MNILRILIFIFLMPFMAHADAFERGSGLNEGDLRMKKYSIQFEEVDDAPVNPPGDNIKLYAKDDSGTTKLYTLDSDGNEVELGTASGGSGTGDVSSNTSSSVDSEIALFSGTGGKTIKRATGNGFVKATAGVVSYDNSTYYKSGDSPSFAGITVTGLTASRPVITDVDKVLSSGTYSGNTTTIATTSGTLTEGNCVEIDASGNLVDAGSACGSGSGSPGGSDTSLQFNNGGSFGGFGAWNGNTFSLTASNASGIWNITNNADGGTVWAHDTLFPNLTTGHRAIYLIGENNSTSNAAYFGFGFDAQDSADNYVTLGMWGEDDLLKIYTTGNATLTGDFTANNFSGASSGNNTGDQDLSGYQPLDPDLTYLAGFTPSANVKTILNAADYAAIRTALGLVIGTNVQAYDADLTTYAGITPSSNVQTLLGATDYAAFKTSLSLNNVDNTSDTTKNAASVSLTNKDLTSGTNTFPTFNQNTTGSAAKLTTARNLAGNSFDGSANVTFANKFIVQGTSDSGLSGAQFLGSLSTGLVKNTTLTGELSIATAGTDYSTPSSTDTLTNKTYDTSGTGNVFKINGTSITDKTGSGKAVLDNSPTLITPNLGTPSAVNLSNGTALPVSGITSSTSTALGVGSIELGHASDTTLARSAAGVMSVEGLKVVLSNTNSSSGSATSLTPLVNGLALFNQYIFSTTASAGTLTLNNPTVTGSATDGQKLEIRIKTTNAQTLSLGSNYESFGVPLPTATLAGKTTTIGLEYISADSKWGCIALTQQQ